MVLVSYAAAAAVRTTSRDFDHINIPVDILTHEVVLRFKSRFRVCYRGFRAETDLEMKPTSRCAVCWACVTLLAPPDPARGGLGHTRITQTRFM